MDTDTRVDQHGVRHRGVVVSLVGVLVEWWQVATRGAPTRLGGASRGHTVATASRAVSAVARQALLAVAASLFVALCAQVAIYLPFSPVPITGQTFGVLVVGGLLGSRLGAAALLLYLAEGAVGLPVFSPGPTLGLARFLSPSGGYLLGFVAGAWVVGRLGEAGWHRRLGLAVLSLLLGNLAIYAGGLVGLALHFPLERALVLGVYPFLVGDILKILLAAAVVVGQRPFIRR